jgi:hypothetical protein
MPDDEVYLDTEADVVEEADCDCTEPALDRFRSVISLRSSSEREICSLLTSGTPFSLSILIEASVDGVKGVGNAADPNVDARVSGASTKLGLAELGRRGGKGMSVRADDTVAGETERYDGYLASL